MFTFYKVKNLMTFGQYDYKGLDLDQFIAGSQVYNDTDNEFAVASTEEGFDGHADVTQITEAEYLAYREAHKPKPVTPVDAEALRQQLSAANEEVAALRGELEATQEVIDFLLLTRGGE
ncbi:hypothetical protein NYE70_09950 [Paenibacillus sp. FSL R5-0407]|uniref:hypothetical protein n=1 Tax=Paenibacillus sp. FSL R5-0407 TaxID=2975320 RepID=UPI0030FB4C92